MLDWTEHRMGGLRPEPIAALPIADLVIGQSTESAAALLPRLFNLCRTAQEIAARLAFGLPVSADAQDALHREVLRDHVMKLCLKLPGYFGQPTALPQGWSDDGDGLRCTLFGSAGKMPRTPDEFDMFLRGDTQLAAILTKIDLSFGPGEATAHLPLATDTSVLTQDAQENSIATRHADHPVLQHVARRKGRGPLWRATARAIDLDMCLARRLPEPKTPAQGIAIVAATRGCYAIKARVSDGIVTAFERITPTDHLLAEGSILEQSLNTLPGGKSGLAPLVMDILDPCSPVRLREVEHA